jgi:hypothetical protein
MHAWFARGKTSSAYFFERTRPMFSFAPPLDCRAGCTRICAVRLEATFPAAILELDCPARDGWPTAITVVHQSMRS